MGTMSYVVAESASERIVAWYGRPSIEDGLGEGEVRETEGFTAEGCRLC